MDPGSVDMSNEALVVRAEQRVAAGEVDESTFDDAYRRHSAARLLEFAQGSVPSTSVNTVIHGDAHLELLEIDPGAGSGRWRRTSEPAFGDPYRDLATISGDLAAGGAGPDVLGAFFAAYGIEHPDVLRLDFHVLVDQLLRAHRPRVG